VARLDQSSVSSVFVCPRCGAPIPHVTGFSDWCACGHGLVPREPAGRVAAGYEWPVLGERAERRLVDELARPGATGAEPPRATRALVALALAVQLVWLAPIAAGLALVALGAPGPFAVAVGAALVALGVAAAAVGGRAASPAGTPVTRDVAPALWGLVDEVAAIFDMRPPVAVLVDDGLTARLAQRGRRRSPVLVLGLPLLVMLEPGERVALVARALAEDVAGDPLRGALAGRAVARADRLAARLAAVRPLHAAAARVAAALRHLALPDEHRAAYRADVLAAGVAGRAAFRDLLDLRHLADGAERVVDNAAAARGSSGGAFAALRAWASACPARELERIHRVERLPGSRLGADEPPTGCRLELLRRLPERAGALAVDATDAAALDRDLRALETLVEPALLAAARRRLRAAEGARGPAR
jgi:hypothetical protein